MSTSFTDYFEPSSAAAWKQKIQFELNGADYAKTLLTATNEGILIKPFYHSDDFEKLPIKKPIKVLKSCYSIEISSEEEANTLAVETINKGINALKFFANKPFDSNTLFTNLLQKGIEFHFHFNFLNEPYLNELSDLLKNETVFFNIDCIGKLASTGNWHTSLNEDFKILEQLILKNKTLSTIGVNATIYQNAGANCIQQIAYTLAHINEYLHKFSNNITATIQINFAIGGNFFFEIAKIRAFSYLLDLIYKEYNIPNNYTIYCEPSLRNKSPNNFNINTLRTQTELSSAILGGSSTFGIPKNIAFSVSEMIQLKENFENISESNMTTNTYYIEAITKQLAEKALIIFKEIEKSGGFLHQLKEGTIQRKIIESAKKEQLQFDKREFILVGENKFLEPTNSNEKPFIKKETPIKNSVKTLIIPITAKQLVAKLEFKKQQYGS